MVGKKQASVEDIIDLMRNGGEAFFPPLSSRHPGIDTDVRAIFKDCADRLEAAWKREVAKLIPAKNIEFFDGKGRRTIYEGWVKKGE